MIAVNVDKCLHQLFDVLNELCTFFHLLLCKITLSVCLIGYIIAIQLYCAC